MSKSKRDKNKKGNKEKEIKKVNSQRQNEQKQTNNINYNINGNKQLNKIQIADVINSIIALLTFFSVVGVFYTVHEMKVERDTMYRPSIVMNQVQIQFEWDENGIPVSIKNSSTENYSVVNIGNGTAKNVVFMWDENNTKRLNDYLLSCNQKNDEFCIIGEQSDVFKYGNRFVQINKEIPMSLMYMKTDDNPYSLYIPQQYVCLIEKAIQQGYMDGNNNPLLFLKVNCQDIQGKTLSDYIYIKINKILYEDNEDGSGKAIYQLVPVFPE